jgi:hypothetical protein
MPVLSCGVNTIQGIPQLGFGFGVSTKTARTAAIDMANTLMNAVFNTLEPTYTCPPVECKNKNVAGIVNRKVIDLGGGKMMAGAFIAIVLITWDMRLECRYKA